MLFLRWRDIKIVSWITIFLFSPSNLIWAQAPIQVVNPSINQMKIEVPSKISIPADLGSIEVQRMSDVQKPFIVYIQDAHAIVDAQVHIQSLIRYLQEKYGISLVAVEGGQGKLDATLFRAFPDNFVKDKILRRYVDQGELTGAGVASIMNPKAAHFYGIEDWGLYEENYIAYLNGRKNQEPIRQKLKNLRGVLDARRKQAYSQELNELFEKVDAFQEEKSQLLELLKFMVRYAKQDSFDPQKYSHIAILLKDIAEENPHRNESLDVSIRRMAVALKTKYEGRMEKKAEMEFNTNYQAFVTGQMDAGKFLKFIVTTGQSLGLKPKLTPMMRELLGNTETLTMIKGTKLFDELEAWIEEIEKRLANTSEQREIAETYKKIRLLKNMAAMELSRDELEKYRSDRGSYLRIFGDERKLLYPQLAFYKYALERDGIFHKNLVDLMKKEKTNAAIVLTGGFHSRGFENELKEAGYSYAIITPKINSLQGQEAYSEVMQGKLSYKNYLETTFYDAFARHSTMQLVKELDQLEFGKNLKGWRDNVIRMLSEEGRIAEAGKYTKYIDLLFKIYYDKFGAMAKKPVSRDDIIKAVEKELGSFRDDSINRLWGKFQRQLKNITRGLRDLTEHKELTAENVRLLIEGSAQGKPQVLSPTVVLSVGIPAESSVIKIAQGQDISARSYTEADLVSGTTEVMPEAEIVREVGLPVAALVKAAGTPLPEGDHPELLAIVDSVSRMSLVAEGDEEELKRQIQARLDAAGLPYTPDQILARAAPIIANRTAEQARVERAPVNKTTVRAKKAPPKTQTTARQIAVGKQSARVRQTVAETKIESDAQPVTGEAQTDEISEIVTRVKTVREEPSELPGVKAESSATPSRSENRVPGPSVTDMRGSSNSRQAELNLANQAYSELSAALADAAGRRGGVLEYLNSQVSHETVMGFVRQNYLRMFGSIPNDDQIMSDIRNVSASLFTVHEKIEILLIQKYQLSPEAAHQIADMLARIFDPSAKRAKPLPGTIEAIVYDLAESGTVFRDNQVSVMFALNRLIPTDLTDQEIVDQLVSEGMISARGKAQAMAMLSSTRETIKTNLAIREKMSKERYEKENIPMVFVMSVGHRAIKTQSRAGDSPKIWIQEQRADEPLSLKNYIASLNQSLSGPVWKIHELQKTLRGIMERSSLSAGDAHQITIDLRAAFEAFDNTGEVFSSGANTIAEFQDDEPMALSGQSKSSPSSYLYQTQKRREMAINPISGEVEYRSENRQEIHDLVEDQARQALGSNVGDEDMSLIVARVIQQLEQQKSNLERIDSAVFKNMLNLVRIEKNIRTELEKARRAEAQARLGEDNEEIAKCRFRVQRLNAVLRDVQVAYQGDIHADYEKLKTNLAQTGLVDTSGETMRWLGEEGDYAIQAGDEIDRGDEPLKVFQALRDLQSQARLKGGDVIRLLGNHEMMLIQGMLGNDDALLNWYRYIGSKKQEELDALVKDLRVRRPQLDYYDAIREIIGDRQNRYQFDYNEVYRGLMEDIARGDVQAAAAFRGRLVTHAGMRRSLRTQLRNEIAARLGIRRKDVSTAHFAEYMNVLLVEAIKKNRFDHEIFGDDGIFWVRGIMENPKEAEEAGFVPQVIAHTPQKETPILITANGNLINIDVDFASNTSKNLGYVRILKDGKIRIGRFVDGVWQTEEKPQAASNEEDTLSLIQDEHARDVFTADWFDLFRAEKYTGLVDVGSDSFSSRGDYSGNIGNLENALKNLRLNRPRAVEEAARVASDIRSDYEKLGIIIPTAMQEKLAELEREISLRRGSAMRPGAQKKSVAPKQKMLPADAKVQALNQAVEILRKLDKFPKDQQAAQAKHAAEAIMELLANYSEYAGSVAALMPIFQRIIKTGGYSNIQDFFVEMLPQVSRNKVRNRGRAILFMHVVPLVYGKDQIPESLRPWMAVIEARLKSTEQKIAGPVKVDDDILLTSLDRKPKEIITDRDQIDDFLQNPDSGFHAMSVVDADVAQEGPQVIRSKRYIEAYIQRMIRSLMNGDISDLNRFLYDHIEVSANGARVFVPGFISSIERKIERRNQRGSDASRVQTDLAHYMVLRLEEAMTEALKQNPEIARSVDPKLLAKLDDLSRKLLPIFIQDEISEAARTSDQDRGTMDEALMDELLRLNSQYGYPFDPEDFNRLAPLLVDLFAERMKVTQWRARRGGIDYRIMEDFGSGETISMPSWEEVTRGIVGDEENDREALKRKIVFEAHEAWSKNFRFSDNSFMGLSEGGASSWARRVFERQITEKTRSRTGRQSGIQLVGSQRANGEEILTVVELLSMLPLGLLTNVSRSGALAGGIDLTAGRSLATRIGHYDEEKKQLGIQPTIFTNRQYIEAFLHEFGHVTMASLSPEAFNKFLAILARIGNERYAISALGGSKGERQGYIASANELFAETFMHFILHNKEFAAGFKGHGVSNTDAWKELYEFYRDEVFQGATYEVDEQTGRVIRRGGDAVSEIPEAVEAEVGEEPSENQQEEDGTAGFVPQEVMTIGGELQVEFQLKGERLFYRINNGSVGSIAFPANSTLSVGRHPNNDIEVPDSKVSRFHLQLRRDASGKVSFREVKSKDGSLSKNGIKYNGINSFRTANKRAFEDWTTLPGLSGKSTARSEDRQDTGTQDEMEASVETTDTALRGEVDATAKKLEANREGLQQVGDGLAKVTSGQGEGEGGGEEEELANRLILARVAVAQNMLHDYSVDDEELATFIAIFGDPLVLHPQAAAFFDKLMKAQGRPSNTRESRKRPKPFSSQRLNLLVSLLKQAHKDGFVIDDSQEELPQEEVASGFLAATVKDEQIPYEELPDEFLKWCIDKSIWPRHWPQAWKLYRARMAVTKTGINRKDGDQLHGILKRITDQKRKKIEELTANSNETLGIETQATYQWHSLTDVVAGLMDLGLYQWHDFSDDAAFADFAKSLGIDPKDITFGVAMEDGSYQVMIGTKNLEYLQVKENGEIVRQIKLPTELTAPGQTVPVGYSVLRIDQKNALVIVMQPYLSVSGSEKFGFATVHDRIDVFMKLLAWALTNRANQLLPTLVNPASTSIITPGGILVAKAWDAMSSNTATQYYGNNIKDILTEGGYTVGVIAKRFNFRSIFGERVIFAYMPIGMESPAQQVSEEGTGTTNRSENRMPEAKVQELTVSSRESVPSDTELADAMVRDMQIGFDSFDDLRNRGDDFQKRIVELRLISEAAKANESGNEDRAAAYQRLAGTFESDFQLQMIKSREAREARERAMNRRGFLGLGIVMTVGGALAYYAAKMAESEESSKQTEEGENQPDVRTQSRPMSPEMRRYEYYRARYETLRQYAQRNGIAVFEYDQEKFEAKKLRETHYSKETDIDGIFLPEDKENNGRPSITIRERKGKTADSFEQKTDARIYYATLFGHELNHGLFHRIAGDSEEEKKKIIDDWSHILMGLVEDNRKDALSLANSLMHDASRASVEGQLAARFGGYQVWEYSFEFFSDLIQQLESLGPRDFPAPAKEKKPEGTIQLRKAIGAVPSGEVILDLAVYLRSHPDSRASARLRDYMKKIGYPIPQSLMPAQARSENRSEKRTQPQRAETPRKALLGFMRNGAGKIEPIYSDSAEFESQRDFGEGGLGMLASNGWVYGREARVIPLMIETAGEAELTPTTDWDLLSDERLSELKRIFESGNILVTAPTRGDPKEIQSVMKKSKKTKHTYEVLMMVGKKDYASEEDGRTGVLLIDGEPLILADPVTGNEFVLEIKGVGIPDRRAGKEAFADGYERSNVMGVRGGVRQDQALREFEALEGQRERNPRFSVGDTPRLMGNIKFKRGNSEQGYLLRLAPGTVRATFRSNPEFEAKDDAEKERYDVARVRKTASEMGYGIGEHLSQGMLASSHAENLISMNYGQYYVFTDYSDVRPFEAFPARIGTASNDLYDMIVASLESAAEIPHFSKYGGLNAFVEGMLESLIQRGKITSKDKEAFLNNPIVKEILSTQSSSKDQNLKVFEALRDFLWQKFIARDYYLARRQGVDRPEFLKGRTLKTKKADVKKDLVDQANRLEQTYLDYIDLYGQDGQDREKKYYEGKNAALGVLKTNGRFDAEKIIRMTKKGTSEYDMTKRLWGDYHDLLNEMQLYLKLELDLLRSIRRGVGSDLVSEIDAHIKEVEQKLEGVMQMTPHDLFLKVSEGTDSQRELVELTYHNKKSITEAKRTSQSLVPSKSRSENRSETAEMSRRVFLQKGVVVAAGAVTGAVALGALMRGGSESQSTYAQIQRRNIVLQRFSYEDFQKSQNNPNYQRILENAMQRVPAILRGLPTEIGGAFQLINAENIIIVPRGKLLVDVPGTIDLKTGIVFINEAYLNLAGDLTDQARAARFTDVVAHEGWRLKKFQERGGVDFQELGNRIGEEAARLEMIKEEIETYQHTTLPIAGANAGAIYVKKVDQIKKYVAEAVREIQSGNLDAGTEAKRFVIGELNELQIMTTGRSENRQNLAERVLRGLNDEFRNSTFAVAGYLSEPLITPAVARTIRAEIQTGIVQKIKAIVKNILTEFRLTGLGRNFRQVKQFANQSVYALGAYLGKSLLSAETAKLLSAYRDQLVHKLPYSNEAAMNQVRAVLSAIYNYVDTSVYAFADYLTTPVPIQAIARSEHRIAAERGGKPEQARRGLLKWATDKMQERIQTWRISRAKRSVDERFKATQGKKTEKIQEFDDILEEISKMYSDDPEAHREVLMRMASNPMDRLFDAHKYLRQGIGSNQELMVRCMMKLALNPDLAHLFAGLGWHLAMALDGDEALSGRILAMILEQEDPIGIAEKLKAVTEKRYQMKVTFAGGRTEPMPHHWRQARFRKFIERLLRPGSQELQDLRSVRGRTESEKNEIERTKSDAHILFQLDDLFGKYFNMRQNPNTSGRETELGIKPGAIEEPNSGIQRYLETRAENISREGFREDAEQALGLELPEWQDDAIFEEMTNLLMDTMTTNSGYAPVYFGGDAEHFMVMDMLLRQRLIRAGYDPKELARKPRFFEISRRRLFLNREEYERAKVGGSVAWDNSMIQTKMTSLIKACWDESSRTKESFDRIFARKFAELIAGNASRAKRNPEDRRPQLFNERMFKLFIEFFNSVLKDNPKIVMVDIGRVGVQPLILSGIFNYLKGLAQFDPESARKELEKILPPKLVEQIMPILGQLKTKDGETPVYDVTVKLVGGYRVGSRLNAPQGEKIQDFPYFRDAGSLLEDDDIRSLRRPTDFGEGLPKTDATSYAATDDPNILASIVVPMGYWRWTEANAPRLMAARKRQIPKVGKEPSADGVKKTTSPSPHAASGSPAERRVVELEVDPLNPSRWKIKSGRTVKGVDILKSVIQSFNLTELDSGTFRIVYQASEGSSLVEYVVKIKKERRPAEAAKKKLLAISAVPNPEGERERIMGELDSLGLAVKEVSVTVMREDGSVIGKLPIWIQKKGKVLKARMKKSPDDQERGESAMIGFFTRLAGEGYFDPDLKASNLILEEDEILPDGSNLKLIDSDMTVLLPQDEEVEAFLTERTDPEMLSRGEHLLMQMFYRDGGTFDGKKVYHGLSRLRDKLFFGKISEAGKQKWIKRISAIFAAAEAAAKAATPENKRAAFLAVLDRPENRTVLDKVINILGTQIISIRQKYKKSILLVSDEEFIHRLKRVSRKLASDQEKLRELAKFLHRMTREGRIDTPEKLKRLIDEAELNEEEKQKFSEMFDYPTLDYVRSTDIPVIEEQVLGSQGYHITLEDGQVIALVTEHDRVVPAIREALIDGRIPRGATIFHIDDHADDSFDRREESNIPKEDITEASGDAEKRAAHISTAHRFSRSRENYYGIAVYIVPEVMAGHLGPWFFANDYALRHGTMYEEEIFWSGALGDEEDAYDRPLLRYTSKVQRQSRAEVFGEGPIDVIDLDIDVYAHHAKFVQAQMSQTIQKIAWKEKIEKGEIKTIEDAIRELKAIEEIRELEIDFDNPQIQKAIAKFIAARRTSTEDYISHHEDLCGILAAEALMRDIREEDNLLELLARAKVVTMATSPGYIDQEVAIPLTAAILRELKKYKEARPAKAPMSEEQRQARETDLSGFERDMKRYAERAGEVYAQLREATRASVMPVDFDTAEQIADELLSMDELRKIMSESPDTFESAAMVDLALRKNPRMLTYARLAKTYQLYRNSENPEDKKKADLAITVLLGLYLNNQALPLEERRVLFIFIENLKMPSHMDSLDKSLESGMTFLAERVASGAAMVARSENREPGTNSSDFSGMGGWLEEAYEQQKGTEQHDRVMHALGNVASVVGQSMGMPELAQKALSNMRVVVVAANMASFTTEFNGQTYIAIVVKPQQKINANDIYSTLASEFGHALHNSVGVGAGGEARIALHPGVAEMYDWMSQALVVQSQGSDSEMKAFRDDLAEHARLGRALLDYMYDQNITKIPEDQVAFARGFMQYLAEQSKGKILFGDQDIQSLLMGIARDSAYGFNHYVGAYLLQELLNANEGNFSNTAAQMGKALELKEAIDFSDPVKFMRSFGRIAIIMGSQTEEELQAAAAKKRSQLREAETSAVKAAEDIQADLSEGADGKWQGLRAIAAKGGLFDLMGQMSEMQAGTGQRIAASVAAGLSPAQMAEQQLVKEKVVETAERTEEEEQGKLAGLEQTSTEKINMAEAFADFNPDAKLEELLQVLNDVTPNVGAAVMLGLSVIAPTVRSEKREDLTTVKTEEIRTTIATLGLPEELNDVFGALAELGLIRDQNALQEMGRMFSEIMSASNWTAVDGVKVDLGMFFTYFGAELKGQTEDRSNIRRLVTNINDLRMILEASRTLLVDTPDGHGWDIIQRDFHIIIPLMQSAEDFVKYTHDLSKLCGRDMGRVKKSGEKFNANIRWFLEDGIPSTKQAFDTVSPDLFGEAWENMMILGSTSGEGILAVFFRGLPAAVKLGLIQNADDVGKVGAVLVSFANAIGPDNATLLFMGMPSLLASVIGRNFDAFKDVMDRLKVIVSEAGAEAPILVRIMTSSIMAGQIHQAKDISELGAMLLSLIRKAGPQATEYLQNAFNDMQETGCGSDFETWCGNLEKLLDIATAPEKRIQAFQGLNGLRRVKRQNKDPNAVLDYFNNKYLVQIRNDNAAAGKDEVPDEQGKISSQQTQRAEVRDQNVVEVFMPGFDADKVINQLKQNRSEVRTVRRIWTRQAAKEKKNFSDGLGSVLHDAVLGEIITTYKDGEAIPQTAVDLVDRFFNDQFFGYDAVRGRLGTQARHVDVRELIMRVRGTAAMTLVMAVAGEEKAMAKAGIRPEWIQAAKFMLNPANRKVLDAAFREYQKTDLQLPDRRVVIVDGSFLQESECSNPAAVIGFFENVVANGQLVIPYLDIKGIIKVLGATMKRVNQFNQFSFVPKAGESMLAVLGTDLPLETRRMRNVDFSKDGVLMSHETFQRSQLDASEIMPLVELVLKIDFLRQQLEDATGQTFPRFTENTLSAALKFIYDLAQTEAAKQAVQRAA